MTHHHHPPPRSTGHAHANNHPVTSTAKAGPPPSPVAVVIPKPKQIVLSKLVLESVADRPRNHLGDVLYEPFLKPARTQDPRTGRPPRHPYNSNPKPLPWDLIRDKENCTLTVKIGRQHLTRQSREEITSRRAVWGTEIYTDDSDVVAACIHGGWIRGEWTDDVDTDMLGLENGVGAVDLKESKTDKKKAAASNSPEETAQQPGYLTSPPKTGPVIVPEDRDMHVTLLILPRLEKYSSSTRFGLMSREFGGKLGRDGARAVHDGISFMITGVRFVTNGAGAQSRLRGKARRERMRKAMMEIEGLNNSSIVLSGVKG